MNHALPNWIEHWLGVAPVGPGEGTIWGVESAWRLAPWATVLVVLTLSAAVAAIYTRDADGRPAWLKALLAGLRMSVIALLLLMLAQFVLSLKRTGLPYVALVIDESASMSIADRYADPKLREALAARAKQAGFDEVTRENLAKTLLLENDARLLRRLERDYQLKVYFLSTAARPEAGALDKLTASIRDLEPQGESSQLGRGLRTVLNDLRGTPPAAVILLSDGITTEGESLAEAAAYARRKGTPLFAVALGDPQPVRDLELSDLLVDEVVFVDDIVQFEFNLTGSGYDGQQVEALLREKNSSEPLARMPVTIDAEAGPQKVRLPYRPTEVGEFEYTVEVAPRGDESTADNNRQTRLVSVRKEQIRVLLAQAYPNFEFRYLKNMLERDETIELKTVLQEADPQYSEADRTALPVFPLRKEELFEYDVIMLGDVNPGFLSASVLDHIADFVREKGGGLVLIAGPQFMPAAFRGTELEPLTPVALDSLVVPAPGATASEGFLVAPTELGMSTTAFQLGDSAEESRRIWQNLPPLYWHVQAAKLRPAARVLAEHSSAALVDGRKTPLIVLEYVGAGKVLFHAFDESWRWRYQVGDIYFARYWAQMLRYLSRAKLLGKSRQAELTVDRREYERGETVRLRVRFSDERTAPANDDGVTVMVQRAGGRQQAATLARSAANQGVFEGSLTELTEGDYHAWVTAPQLEGSAPACDFLVRRPPGEFVRTQMDEAELSRAARETGGQAYNFVTARRLLGDLPRGRQIPIDVLPSIPLWNRWPVLVLFLALLIGEWLLRKRIGLL